MKTMKLWRLAFTMLAAFSLVSCSDDDSERRLTPEQKETYAQSIAGEYPGSYVIIYKDRDCKEWTDEEGHHMMESHEETVSGVQVDVSDIKMLHVFFQGFPVSLISKVVDADEWLSHALAETSSQAITARYGFDLDTDYSHVKWAFIPNVMLLQLNYNGADHHIRIEFDNNSQYYTFTKEELNQPKPFIPIAENGIALQLKVIYDGPTLIQRFGSVDGNYMHIMFYME